MANAPTAPTAAQVTHTTSFISSPQFLGAVTSLIIMVAQHFGFTFLASAEGQALLSVALGWIAGSIGSWLFPGASGRLGLSSPLAWNAPAPQDLPAGETSLVKVPAPTAPVQDVTVRPANDIAATIRTAEVAAAKASAKMSVGKGRPIPVTVTVTPAGQPNEAIKISQDELDAAPSAPLNVEPSPAPKAPAP